MDTTADSSSILIAGLGTSAQNLRPETIQDLIDNGYTLGKLPNSTDTVTTADWSNAIQCCLACSHSEVNQHSVVFSKSALSEYIWVRLPEVSSNFIIDSIRCINPNTVILDLDNILMENIWLKLPIGLMDVSSGTKIYQMRFNHRLLNETLTLYFGYVIQDDNPEKPYVYMKRGGEQ